MLIFYLQNNSGLCKKTTNIKWLIFVVLTIIHTQALAAAFRASAPVLGKPGQNACGGLTGKRINIKCHFLNLQFAK